MARKITTEAVQAFVNGQEFSRDNTRVEVRPWQQTKYPRDQVILLLHGNPIARYQAGDTSLRSLVICDGNHQTNTTKERLNGLPGVRVHQKAGKWYLNGAKWDGSWTHAGDVMVVKRVGTRRYSAEYPHAAGLKPVEFPSLAAARTFAEVEAANHGYRLVDQGAA